jgi:hypothetical protein
VIVLCQQLVQCVAVIVLTQQSVVQCVVVLVLTLQSVVQEASQNRSVEGRRVRRELLKDGVMVFITSGYSGKRFIFEKAKDLGLKTVVIDGPDR